MQKSPDNCSLNKYQSTPSPPGQGGGRSDLQNYHNPTLKTLSSQQKLLSTHREKKNIWHIHREKELENVPEEIQTLGLQVTDVKSNVLMPKELKENRRTKLIETENRKKQPTLEPKPVCVTAKSGYVREAAFTVLFGGAWCPYEMKCGHGEPRAPSDQPSPEAGPRTPISHCCFPSCERTHPTAQATPCAALLQWPRRTNTGWERNQVQRHIPAGRRKSSIS